MEDVPTTKHAKEEAGAKSGRANGRTGDNGFKRGTCYLAGAQVNGIARPISINPPTIHQ